MKNKLKLLAILALAFSLFACEGKKEEAKPAATTTTEQPATPAPAVSADNAATESVANPPAVVEDVTVIEEGTVAVPTEEAQPAPKESAIDKAVDKGAAEIKADATNVEKDVNKAVDKVKVDPKDM